MSDLAFASFHVTRYRSLIDVKIDINNSFPVVICGENNIGKTNFLRALNLFFNHAFHADLFNPSVDIPHHIYEGSRGGRTNTELTGTFQSDIEFISVKAVFENGGDVTYKINNKDASKSEVTDILSKFQFLLVESHNVDLPSLISTILEKDGLLRLDSQRAKQTQPLQKLEEFIKLSQKAISDIEKGINECFGKLTDFDGILKDKQIKISFAEFERLRDVVKSMTSITLFDGNNHGIASKGSGAQRAVFLALVQYISKNSKRKIIWGIDEPEAFLQPRLQKKVADVLSGIVKQENQPVILTTHSQHFINLSNLTSTHIFKGTLEPREYKRRPGKTYYETNTDKIKTSSDFEKAMLIKQHLGISNNDGWEVLPYNILVEGEEDKRYLEVLFACINLPSPNIIWSGGAAKIGGYLQYYNIFAKDLGYKPKFICIFDNDNEGRDQAKKIKSYNHIDVDLAPLLRHDGKSPEKTQGEDWEIEDFLPPAQIIEVINFVIKKEGYAKLSKKQINDRSQPAHIKKQILKYAEECCNHNNPDKPPLTLDDQGRKKQICQKFCDQSIVDIKLLILSNKQKDFLKRLLPK